MQSHSITSSSPMQQSPVRPRRLLAQANLLALVLALGACATVPTPLQGNFAAVSPAAAIEHDATGQAVRWGGTIAAVESLPGQTCFQLVGRALDEAAQPTINDRAEGRFLACRQGFYEPQVFAPGRSLTVTGHVVDYENRKIGDYDYREPKLAADVIYLWPVQREVDVYAEPVIWWGTGWGWGWGWGRRGRW